MPKDTLTTQAALIYADRPGLPFDTILDRLNSALAKRDIQPMETRDPSSREFRLIGNDRLHATIAIHGNPLGSRGQTRALKISEQLGATQDFEALAQTCPAHIQICVGEGPSPVLFEAPKPVPAAQRLMLLFTVLRLVMGYARPAAVHLCVSDRFYDSDDLEQSLSGGPAPDLLWHPQVFARRQDAGGRTREDLVLHQSECLLGRTLILSGLPAKMPLAQRLDLAQRLTHQHLDGSAPLEDGVIAGSDGQPTLSIRTFPPDLSAPHGRIVAEATGSTPSNETVPLFAPHRGYSAVSHDPGDPGDPAKPGLRPGDSGADDTGWQDHDIPSARPGPRPKTRKSAAWITLGVLGLFLWVGLPMLNLPKLALEAAYSEPLDLMPQDRGN